MAFKVSFSLVLLSGFILFSISPGGGTYRGVQGYVFEPVWEYREKDLKEFSDDPKNAKWVNKIENGKSCTADSTEGKYSKVYGHGAFTLAAGAEEKLNELLKKYLAKFCKSKKCKVSGDDYHCYEDVKTSSAKPGGGNSGSSSRQPIQLMTALAGLFVVISVLLMNSFGLV